MSVVLSLFVCPVVLCGAFKFGGDSVRQQCSTPPPPPIRSAKKKTPIPTHTSQTRVFFWFCTGPVHHRLNREGVPASGPVCNVIRAIEVSVERLGLHSWAAMLDRKLKQKQKKKTLIPSSSRIYRSFKQATERFKIPRPRALVLNRGACPPCLGQLCREEKNE